MAENNEFKSDAHNIYTFSILISMFTYNFTKIMMKIKGLALVPRMTEVPMSYPANYICILFAVIRTAFVTFFK